MKTIVVRIIVECPICKSKREVDVSELIADDQPLCENDGMPMSAISASHQFVEVEAEQ